MEVTPLVPAGRQIVERYGDGRFRVSGVTYEGSVLVFPDDTRPWAVGAIGEVTPESLAAVVDRAQTIDILLLGTGARMALAPADLRETLITAAVALEVMDTGAACRTYNVLAAEERRVAAALIAVD